MAAAKCVLHCTHTVHTLYTAGESCAGCRSHLQREFGGIRQVLAQQLPQSQQQQFTLSPPSTVSLTANFLSFVPIFPSCLYPFSLSNNKGNLEQISALTLVTATFNFLYR